MSFWRSVNIRTTMWCQSRSCELKSVQKRENSPLVASESRMSDIKLHLYLSQSIDSWKREKNTYHVILQSGRNESDDCQDRSSWEKALALSKRQRVAVERRVPGAAGKFVMSRCFHSNISSVKIARWVHFKIFMHRIVFALVVAPVIPMDCEFRVLWALRRARIPRSWWWNSYRNLITKLFQE